MRVIAGDKRSMPLKTPKGDDTRPTSDRYKETLFNVIQEDIPDARFLDLFAGSGGIAIEALSRGAKEAVLVENNRNAIACIKENLEFTHLKEKAVLMESDVLAAIGRLKGRGRFDIIFMDPPYSQGFYEPVIRAITDADILKSSGMLICETLLDTDMSFVSQYGLNTYKIKEYKTNKHVFLVVNNS